MVETLYIDAVWKKELVLDKKTIDYIKKNNYHSIALFASVQFLKLDTIKKQLKDIGITVLITKAKRTDKEGQILGCDAYHDSYTVNKENQNIIEQADALLYVGDGLFHPKALLLAQSSSKNFKDVIIYDPVSEKMRIITKQDVVDQLKKLKANIKLFLYATSIGILVSLKPGQNYLPLAKKLQEKLQKDGKKCYIFVDDTINLSNLENYPFIQCWVNTACPRIGFDDLTTIEKPLINIRDALDPIKSLERMG